MAGPVTTPTIGDVLNKVGCPLVEIAAGEPLESIARLLAFCGLDAVLLVRPCGRPERIISTRDLLGAFSGRPCAAPCPADLPRCSPDDPVFAAARSMLRGDHGALLVEQAGRRLAIITLDSLAAYLIACDPHP